MDFFHSSSPANASQRSLPFFLSPSIKKERACAAFSFPFLLLSFLLLSYIVRPFPHLSLLRRTFFSEATAEDGCSSSMVETCDYSNGRWVWDESGAHRWYTEDCPFLDPGFQCHRNGRKDTDYHKWRWQPDGCNLPRFNASELLERSRNRRVVFVGDSIGRNQWESLLCMLARAVSNLSRIYEENGSPISRHKGYLSMRFHDYNLTVEYYRTPFLAAVDRPPPNSSQEVERALRIDQLDSMSSKWIGADVLLFNAGHWWNDDKTIKMGWYFQEGKSLDLSMDVKEAFRRSLGTWKLWALRNLNLDRSRVFFRSYSPIHFGGGTWDRNGSCLNNTKPETNYSSLEAEPWHNQVISKIIKQINDEAKKVHLLNITYLTELRKDGHPSSHREPGTPLPAVEDCSHWCLPGVPDTWNEIFYAHLFSKEQHAGSSS